MQSVLWMKLLVNNINLGGRIMFLLYFTSLLSKTLKACTRTTLRHQLVTYIQTKMTSYTRRLISINSPLRNTNFTKFIAFLHFHLFLTYKLPKCCKENDILCIAIITVSRYSGHTFVYVAKHPSLYSSQ